MRLKLYYWEYIGYGGFLYGYGYGRIQIGIWSRVHILGGMPRNRARVFTSVGRCHSSIFIYILVDEFSIEFICFISCDIHVFHVCLLIKNLSSYWPLAHVFSVLNPLLMTCEDQRRSEHWKLKVVVCCVVIQCNLFYQFTIRAFIFGLRLCDIELYGYLNFVLILFSGRFV